MSNFFTSVYQAIMINDVAAKIQQTYLLHHGLQDNIYNFTASPEIYSITDAGRPLLPKLVAPKDVPRRRLSSDEGIRAMLHAIIHIEFNAINLALDAAYRFQNMPMQYYVDWISVAKEEAYHFSLLELRLQELGGFYGEFTAHAGLWESCVETEYDVMVRMALVPRVMEARGLDVTPFIQEKLRKAGEIVSADLLNIIYRDEKQHVAIGSKWFKFCCDQRKCDYVTTFQNLLHTYAQKKIKAPFNDQARLAAGFDQIEIDFLNNLGKKIPT